MIKREIAADDGEGARVFLEALGVEAFLAELAACRVAIGGVDGSEPAGVFPGAGAEVNALLGEAREPGRESRGLGWQRVVIRVKEGELRHGLRRFRRVLRRFVLGSGYRLLCLFGLGCAVRCASWGADRGLWKDRVEEGPDPARGDVSEAFGEVADGVGRLWSGLADGGGGHVDTAHWVWVSVGSALYLETEPGEVAGCCVGFCAWKRRGSGTPQGGDGSRSRGVCVCRDGDAWKNWEIRWASLHRQFHLLVAGDLFEFVLGA